MHPKKSVQTYKNLYKKPVMKQKFDSVPIFLFFISTVFERYFVTKV